MFDRLFQRVSRPRPVPVAIPTAEQQFPHSTIFVRPATLPGGASYTATVLQHLNEINSFPIGQQFIQDLAAIGKRQIIVYGGPNSNQAAGTPAGYFVLRKAHDGKDKPTFAGELRTAMSAAGKTVSMLAKELISTRLPRWSGTYDYSPFAHPPAGGTSRGVPRTPPQVEKQINDWLAGTELPTVDEMDVLCLKLEPGLTRGGGVGTRINYDPHKVQTAAGSRPPHVALFHELVHAYYNAQGTQLGREDSVQESNGGRLFELMSVGLPPFDQRPYSENKFRAALGVPARAKYP